MVGRGGGCIRRGGRKDRLTENDSGHVKRFATEIDPVAVVRGCLASLEMFPSLASRRARKAGAAEWGHGHP